MKKSVFICFCLGLVLSFNFVAAQTDAPKITVESIWKKYEFFGKSFPGFNSMNDGEHFTRQNEEENTITKHAFKNYHGSGEVLVKAEDLKFDGKAISVDDYSFNKDETKMLITSDSKAIYRRSFTAEFYILDLKTKKLSILDNKNPKKTLAEFSPDGSKVAYVSDNNLFVKDLQTDKITQLTNDGKRNAIINGTTDWVYEEEFAITKGFCWSPDSKLIAFLRFDESAVKEYELEFYGSLYPAQYLYKYPKAGEDNSKVSCHLAMVETGQLMPIDLGVYEYIPRLEWSPTNNHLIVQTLNRHQNDVNYHLVDATGMTPVSKVFFNEKSDTYVEIDNNLIILSDGKSLIRTSESSGFNHIHRVYFDGKTEQITKGNWDVIEFLGVDEKSKTIFYTAAEKSPIYKGIYKIKLDGSGKTAISAETGYNSAEFSKGMKYFMKVSSNANTPNSFSLCDASGKQLALLEGNEKLIEKLKAHQLQPKTFFEIDGAAGKLNAWIIKPAGMEAGKKYPVYMTVYGGPGSNMVTDDFDGNDYMYHQMLAQKGYIVVCVDPRGTMFRGAAFKKSTYQQLGKLEIEDVIAVAQNLGKMDYVDAKRIGIMGWSYGGYMSSLAMTKGADFFKMGIAVAPVTNWRYYDNIYTERFMRTPQENASGYDDNSPINHVKKMKGKYLLIHGSADDNVHYQNTMEMIQALTSANVQFDLFIYPNKNHGIYGGNTRNHLFNLMLNYTLENL